MGMEHPKQKITEGKKKEDLFKSKLVEARLRVDPQGERRRETGPDFRTDQKWEQVCRTWRALQRSLSLI